MNTRRIVFLSLFGVYQLAIFAFTLILEHSDFSFLIDLFTKIRFFKYGAMLGVLLLVIEFVWSRNDARKIANPEKP